MKQLLVDTQIFLPIKQTLHEVKAGGNISVQGILATANVQNGNGRVYRESIWKREIEKYMDSVDNRRACGELDHPESTVINLKNVSHIITEVWWDGNKVMGTIEVLPTPSGNILKALIASGISVGVSSRGMGSVKQMGETLEVQDDFELLCWDFVSTPSNPGSWMETVNGSKKSNLREGYQAPIGKDYTKANQIIGELLCSYGQCPLF